MTTSSILYSDYKLLVMNALLDEGYAEPADMELNMVKRLAHRSGLDPSECAAVVVVLFGLESKREASEARVGLTEAGAAALGMPLGVNLAHYDEDGITNDAGIAAHVEAAGGPLQVAADALGSALAYDETSALTQDAVDACEDDVAEADRDEGFGIASKRTGRR